ncbi:MAG: TolC family protein [Deltaproteobacteria bacterium]|nr:TolC family protein [Deltaproteobacteria bacterium]
MMDKSKLKAIVFSTTFLFLAAQMPSCAETDLDAPEGGHDRAIIKQGERLDLRRCIETALARQPGVTVAANNVYSSMNKVFQAQSSYYPQVEATGGYSRTDTASSTATLSRAYDQYKGSVGLKQNLYDFGKTAEAIKAREINLGSSRFDLENAKNQTAFNVKKAYYNALQAGKNKIVAEEAVKQFEQHLVQAKGFYEVGVKPKYDVTSAEVALSEAKVNLIKVKNSLKIARLNLNNAMGAPDAPDFEIVDDEEATLRALKEYSVTLEGALAKAFANRPDLKSAVEKKRSAERGVELARKGYYPYLSGAAAYNWSGESFPLDNGWSAGASITIPIFSGFLTKYQVAESKADLGAARANAELLRQSVSFEVQQSYFNLKEAEERIPAAELSVKKAAENLDLANARYSTGVGNPVETTDASVAYSNAKLAYGQALSDYNIAQAFLVLAVGGR